MPATAGRVRMPANNRVHSSAALQTHGIWQSAIGYDPYAPTNKDDSKKSSTHKASSSTEPEAENAYASFQGLLALAKITNSNSDEARGACKRCGRVGHLYIQCRNFLSVKDAAAKAGKDDDLIPEVVLEKLKGEKVKKGELNGESSDSDDEEEEEEEASENSDSDYDSEIERIIAERAKKVSGKVKVRSRRVDDSDNKGVNDRREKRGRSKKRRSGRRDNSDSEDEERRSKRRKEKRRRRDDDDESSDAEEERRRRKRKSRKERRRRRSHRHSSDDSSEASPDDSGDRRHKRRSRRAASTSESDPSGSDDPRVGRDKKRSEKKSRKGRQEDED